MKVKVSIMNLSKAEAAFCGTLDITVAAEDTVLSLKERIDIAAPVPIAEQELLLNDTVLRDSDHLSASGVEDQDTLVLRLRPTEAGLAKQLAALIKGKGISPEELSLIYTHKHGLTVREALDSLGRGGEKLQDFLGRQKGFVCEGGLVKAQVALRSPAECTTAPATPALSDILLCDSSEDEGFSAAPDAFSAAQDTSDLQEQPKQAPEKASLRSALLKVVISVVVRALGQPDQEVDDVDVALEASGSVAAAKRRIAQEALVPFPECDLVFQGRVLEEQACLADCAVKDGATLLFIVRASEEALVHQLKDILRAREALSPDQLASQYCVKHGVPLNQALRSLGLRITPRRFVERHAAFSVDGGCVRLAHRRSQKFERVAGFLLEAMAFLNIQSVKEGGQDGEAVVYLRGLPPAAKEEWMPGLLHAVAAALEGRLGDAAAKTGGVVGVRAAKDTVQVLLEGGAVMSTRLAAA
mmetsp:Transcript_28962/g.63708  ORF Transcript_28962/g.63708 Transcript_28962/m.63708 type:complete len:470 (+) Transcript_28962:179-1588(+)